MCEETQQWCRGTSQSRSLSYSSPVAKPVLHVHIILSLVVINEFGIDIKQNLFFLQMKGIIVKMLTHVL